MSRREEREASGVKVERVAEDGGRGERRKSGKGRERENGQKRKRREKIGMNKIYRDSLVILL